jgi:hypothetical protein
MKPLHDLKMEYDPVDIVVGDDITLMIRGAIVAAVLGLDQFLCVERDDEQVEARHQAEVEAIAERIVACWNHCRGIPLGELCELP